MTNKFFREWSHDMVAITWPEAIFSRPNSNTQTFHVLECAGRPYTYFLHVFAFHTIYTHFFLLHPGPLPSPIRCDSTLLEL